MELSAKVLREVEFRDRLRGYDTDEVDEFLEKVAVAVEELQQQALSLAERAERAERAEKAAGERTPGDDEDSIRRTLVLAQRTADLAIREAQEQAALLTDNARAESEALVTEARENAQRISAEADRRLREDTKRLEDERDKVRADLVGLSNLLGAERHRLSEALSSALHFVERTLAPSPDLAEVRSSSSFAGGSGVPPSPSTPHTPHTDDLEAQIDADAKAAAPSPPTSSPAPLPLSAIPPAASPPATDQAGAASPEVPDDRAGGGADGGDRFGGSRPSLSALPPLADTGPDTETWQADGRGSSGGPTGRDWTA